METTDLLQAKQELDSRAGQITLGILLFQDLWAIVFLALQPNLSHVSIEGVLKAYFVFCLQLVTCLLAWLSPAGLLVGWLSGLLGCWLAGGFACWMAC